MDKESKRPFSTAPLPTPPVGEKVPVIGTDRYMEMFVRKASYKKPKYDGFCEAFRGQGRRKSIKFHCVGIEIGSRCHSRPLWNDYVADARTFVILLEHLTRDEVVNYYLNEARIRRDTEQLLNEHDTDKNLLILIHGASDHEIDTAVSPHPLFQEWIDELKKRHQVAHFPVCLETGRGMEVALDWLADHLSTPTPDPDVKKSRSALHWLAAVGKKVLTLGTASKMPS